MNVPIVGSPKPAPPIVVQVDGEPQAFTQVAAVLLSDQIFQNLVMAITANVVQAMGDRYDLVDRLKSDEHAESPG